MDAIVGYQENIFFPKEMVLRLQDDSMCMLNKTNDPTHTTLWSQGCLKVEAMSFEGDN